MYNLFGFLILAFLIALPIGLIKPSLFTKSTKGFVINRKRALAVFGGGLLASFILFGITAPNEIKTETAVKGESVRVEASTQPSEQPIPSLEPSPSPSTSPLPSKTATPKPSVKPSDTPTPTPAPIVVAPAGGTSNSGGGDKDCADFSTESEAQTYFESKGGSPSNNVDRLDADHDGKACESLP